MDVVTTRFGTVSASESEALRVPDGLVGFRTFVQWVLLPDPEAPGLTWLQSTTSPELAFALVPPSLVVGEYKVDLRPGDKAALELEDERGASTFVILNRGENGGLTANLQGPLVFHLARRLGRQLVLTSSRYAVRCPVGEQPLGNAPATEPNPLAPLVVPRLSLAAEPVRVGAGAGPGGPGPRVLA